jgi:hypothetical protein
MSEPHDDEEAKTSPAGRCTLQIVFNVLEDEEDPNHQVVASNIGESATHDQLEEAPEQNLPVKSRQPHVLKDEDGNEKKYGSALGLLTRKFVDLLHVRLCYIYHC